MNAPPDPSKPERRPRARPTSTFYVLLAVAVACVVTMVVVRTGAVAAAAFTGLVLAVFVLLNAALGSPSRPLRVRSGATPRSGDLGPEQEPSADASGRPKDPLG